MESNTGESTLSKASKAFSEVVVPIYRDYLVQYFWGPLWIGLVLPLISLLASYGSAQAKNIDLLTENFVPETIKVFFYISLTFAGVLCIFRGGTRKYEPRYGTAMFEQCFAFSTAAMTLIAGMSICLWGMSHLPIELSLKIPSTLSLVAHWSGIAILGTLSGASLVYLVKDKKESRAKFLWAGTGYLLLGGLLLLTYFV